MKTHPPVRNALSASKRMEGATICDVENAAIISVGFVVVVVKVCSAGAMSASLEW
jgi:hypothetical protein